MLARFVQLGAVADVSYSFATICRHWRELGRMLKRLPSIRDEDHRLDTRERPSYGTSPTRAVFFSNNTFKS